jgi:hypothetical protein
MPGLCLRLTLFRHQAGCVCPFLSYDPPGSDIGQTLPISSIDEPVLPDAGGDSARSDTGYMTAPDLSWSGRFFVAFARGLNQALRDGKSGLIV